MLCTVRVLDAQVVLGSKGVSQSAQKQQSGIIKKKFCAGVRSGQVLESAKEKKAEIC